MGAPRDPGTGEDWAAYQAAVERFRARTRDRRGDDDAPWRCPDAPPSERGDDEAESPEANPPGPRAGGRPGSSRRREAPP